MKYITADQHFYHKFIANWRGFDTVEAMHEVLIDKWNSKITSKDDVFILGDFALCNNLEQLENILNKLNYAQIFFIMGNHDLDKIRNYKKIAYCKDIYSISHNGIYVQLSHYPFATWNRVHYGSVNFHGHCHGSYPSTSQQLDVGVDTNNLFPYSMDEAFAKMETLPKFIVPDNISEYKVPKIIPVTEIIEDYLIK